MGESWEVFGTVQGTLLKKCLLSLPQLSSPGFLSYVLGLINVCHAPTQVFTSPYTSIFPFTALPNLVNGSAIPPIDKTKSLNPIHQQVLLTLPPRCISLLIAATRVCVTISSSLEPFNKKAPLPVSPLPCTLPAYTLLSNQQAEGPF